MGRIKGPRRLFFLLCFVPMLCVFPYLRAVNNPNELTRVFAVMALVENGHYTIDEQVARYGWVNDMAARVDEKTGQRHLYHAKGPALVHLGVPAYWLFAKVIGPALHKHPPIATTPADDVAWWLRMSTWVLRLFAVQLPCFLFLLWFEKYLRDFVHDPVIRYSAVAAGGLGTNFLAYTHMFASHAPYAACAFVAFGITERERRRSRGDARKRSVWMAFLAGFFASACVAFEYQGLFAAAVLALYGLFTFYRPTRLVAFGAGGVINVAQVMIFQWRSFGSPLTPGHKMAENQAFAAVHHKGIFGVDWPSLDAAKALAVDPGFGFFGTSAFMWLGLFAVPLLIWSPYGTPRMRRSLRWGTVVWFLVCLAVFLVNAGFVAWRGGWTVGPRYLVPCGPFFAFGGACFLERLAGAPLWTPRTTIAGAGSTRRAIMRGIAGGLALSSIVTIGSVGLLYDTLPEGLTRPFAQFAYPMIRTGFVPHHIAEWFGWESFTFWYIALGALLLVPVVVGLLVSRERGLAYVARGAVFVAAIGAGMFGALTKPEDGTELFVLHPVVLRDVLPGWEPTGRDRITLLRNEAERFGPRRPCFWYRLGSLDHALGLDGQAHADEARAQGAPRERCARIMF